MNCAVKLQRGQVDRRQDCPYRKSLVQTSALKMSCVVTLGESVHPSYLLFLLFLCPTCLFNLEFVPRRVPCLLCRAGALTPLLPLAGGMAGSLCFLPDPPFPYPRAGLQGTTSCPSGDRQSCHPALAWEGLPLVIHSQGWEVEGSPHFERLLHSPDH